MLRSHAGAISVLAWLVCTAYCSNDTTVHTTASTPLLSATAGPELHRLSLLLLKKFSNGKQSLTREDFNEFLQCSLLGLGCPSPQKLSDYEVGKTSVLDECRSNAAVPPVLCDGMEQCLSLEDFVATVQTPVSEASGDWSPVGSEALERLLPLLVAQSQLPQCWRNVSSLADITETPPLGTLKPSPAEVWGYGLLLVTVISGISLVGVVLLPLIAASVYDSVMTMLIGLAAGSLAASSLFHLLPQAFSLPREAGSHEYLWTSLYCLCGLWMFLLVERAIKMSVALYASHHGITHHHHHHSSGGKRHHTDARYQPSTTHSNSEDGNGSVMSSVEAPVESAFVAEELQGKASELYSKQDFSANDDEVVILKKALPAQIKTVAWMIIFGDAFHNFLDGVSIGAAFTQNLYTGISISIAVMCEELPHELGDFAVLLNSGMSMKQALFYNFLSASTCFLGLGVGILLGEFTENASFIFALAGGMFLYIACVDMIPEMNAALDRACDAARWRKAFTLLALQNVGLVLGVLALFVLAYYQDAWAL